MNYTSLIILAIITLHSCGSAPETTIRGVWKVDSVYLYYNGFEQRQYQPGSDWATYHYNPEGTVREIKFDTYRSYSYDFIGDTLLWRSAAGQLQGKYEILLLSPERMVLKKEKAPIFPGKNQERFEVRYFSRTELPTHPTTPYRPPQERAD